MPRVPVETNSRLAFRIQPEDKAMLVRAAALAHTDVTSFILQNTLPAAREVIEHSEHIRLSERDSLRLLEMLENPPAPTERMIAAARRLPPELE